MATEGKGVWWHNWLSVLAYYQEGKLEYALRSLRSKLLARLMPLKLIFKFTVASNNDVVDQLSFSMLLVKVN